MLHYTEKDYIQVKKCIEGLRLPLAFVDLEAFDHNIAYVAATQKRTGKTIRVASKSIRCLDLIRRVFEKGGSVFQGILAFTMEEARFLIQNGFDDIIVAYPTLGPGDIMMFIEKTRQGAKISLVVDDLDQMAVLSKAAIAAGVVLKVCLDVDMSYRPMGKKIHLGVRRSPIRTVDEAVSIAVSAKKLKGIRVSSLMGYEAQIASLNDNVPGQWIKNNILRRFKHHSSRELTQRRRAIVEALLNKGIHLETINGGGSGSLISTGRDDSVTEVTAGSAFFAPGLFRYFHEVSFRPAAFFALQVVRFPAPGTITCQGGGYVASGEVNLNRLPWPVMPTGLHYFPVEGAGEVQTPLVLPASFPELRLGDPIIFQHAKAGELCERFNDLYLVQDHKIVDRVMTYRGDGHAFL